MSQSQSVVRLDDALRFNATKLPSRLAIACRHRHWCDHPEGLSWRHLDRLVTRVAWQLRELAGFSSGRLVHDVANTVSDVVVALACARAGFIEVPIDSVAGDDYVRQCRVKAGGFWLGQTRKHEAIENAIRLRSVECSWERPSPHDDSLVLWTSGTTESPKGVVLSHRALCCNAKAKLAAAHQAVSDRRLTVLSIGHAYARTCDLGTWLLSGCTLAIARGYDGWRDWSERFQPTVVNVVPSLSERLLADPKGTESLQMLGCGGAAMTADHFDAWGEHKITVIQGYGLTEAGPVISSQTRADSIAGHAGKVVQTWEHRIDSQDRLFVRGPSVMNSYLDDPTATRRRIDDAGWLDTGDVVRTCQRTGQLQILGRADDRLTLSTGYTVDPLVVEKRISSIAGIRSCLLTLDDSGRKLILWLEPESGFINSTSPPNAYHDLENQVDRVIVSLATWERPSQRRWIRISDHDRQRLFGPKGNVRRSEMSEHLRQSNREIIPDTRA